PSSAAKSATPTRNTETTSSRHSSNPTEPDRSAMSPSPEAAGGEHPGTVRLPAGGTATLVATELDGDSAVLPVPENLNEATWWGADLDAARGASVFAGHVNLHVRTGPFAELRETTTRH